LIQSNFLLLKKARANASFGNVLYRALHAFLLNCVSKGKRLGAEQGGVARLHQKVGAQAPKLTFVFELQY
jgi:hypothetical protein